MKFKLLFVFIAVVLAVYGLLGQLQGAVEIFKTLDWSMVMIAFLGLVVYQFINASIWADVLFSLGKQVGKIAASRIWIESESMKWLPGGVWSYGSRVVSAKKLHVSKKLAAASMAWEIMLTNVAWAILACSVVYSESLSQLLKGWLSHLNTISYTSLLIVLGVGIVASTIFRKKFQKLSDKAKVLVDIKHVSIKHSVLVVVKYIILSLFNVSLLYVATLAVPGFDTSWLVIVGVGAIAWLAGFWAIGVPGGIGVREAVMVLLLKDFATIEAAIAVAVLWRVLQIAAEVSGVIVSVSTHKINTKQKEEKNYEMVKTA